MNIETVNELIQSLESAGELSIREQKFLKLAKEFSICSASLDTAIKTGNVLADQNAQLAAENVALNEKLDKLALWPGIEFYSSSWEFNNNDGNEAIEFMCDIETPATDRIVAWIKADGVEEFAAYQRAITEEWVCKEGHSSLLKVAESAELFAKQLREGADK
ncbi:hypothetical protein [Klebsiella pneumoniae]|uniref:hypothetical protein n=1 Tax=Klebsiella pneumoniae TaxID=573 RepID=UPI0030BE01E0